MASGECGEEEAVLHADDAGDEGRHTAARRSRYRLLRLIDDFPEILRVETGLLLRHLDFSSIVRLSRCSPTFRGLGVDPNVWRMLCYFSWGPCKKDVELFGSWRNMFIGRPRPRTDGVYVFKWSTVRYGTNEGKGTKEVGKDYYKPVSIMCMLRLLVFCHGRKVAMITTNTNALPPENVKKAIRRLAAGSLKKTTTRATAAGLGLVCVGTYEMQDKTLVSSWNYVPDQFPKMMPVLMQYTHEVVSSRPGGNEALQTVSHTTGSEEDGTLAHCSVSNRPFSFIPLGQEGFTRKLLALEGWPDCDISDNCPSTAPHSHHPVHHRRRGVPSTPATTSVQA